MRYALDWAWAQWWLNTALWWVCAVLVVASVKHEKHKSMLSFCANAVLGTPLVAPLALRRGWGPLRKHWKPVLLIAILAALERNLTNSSMYHIGGSLKTALHGFNVILTFFAAALLGVDQRSRQCLLRCRCRGVIALIPALLLVASGGLVTALCGSKMDWNGGVLGIALQLASGLCYAMKFALAKLLLGGHGHSQHPSSGDDMKPSKFQIAFICNPITGLTALAFLPFFENSWDLPSWFSIIGVGIGATGILLFELRLTELTSPLTVSVLAIVHNVVIVFFFLVFFGEKLKMEQLAGFGVSSLGAMIYALVKTKGAAVEESREDVAVSFVEGPPNSVATEGSTQDKEVPVAP